MYKLLAGLAAVLAVGTVLAQAPDTEPKKGQLPSIKEIMRESHLCRTSYLNLIRQQLAKENPEELQWEIVTAKSLGLVSAGKMLAMNEPPKGSKASWEHRTTLYVANAVLMHDAAERKDKDDVSYHLKKLGGMCRTCHQEHR